MSEAVQMDDIFFEQIAQVVWMDDNFFFERIAQAIETDTVMSLYYSRLVYPKLRRPDSL